MVEELDNLRDITGDPARWIETFIIDYKTGEPVKLNLKQKEIMSSNYRCNVLRVHRRMGKCSYENDFCTLSDGSRVQFKELVGKSFDLLSIVEGQIKSVPAFATYNDFEEVYEITTDSGRKIIRNAEHPFWKGTSVQVKQNKPKITSIGWTNTSDLQAGDLLAAPINLPYELPGLDSKIEEIKVIAYLIGDGSVSTKSGVQFTQEDNTQLKEFIESCNSLSINVTKYSTEYQYGLSNALSLTRKYDIQGKNSFTKVVPKEFFKMSLEQTSIFLSRLYSTDGWASLRRNARTDKDIPGTLRGAGQIGYCSVSRQLIDDIQHLLLRFGINSTIGYKKKTNSYTLSILDFENIISFIEKIGIFGKEESCYKLYDQCLKLKEEKYGKSEDLIWENGSLYKIYKDIRPNWRTKKTEVFTRKIDVTPWRVKNAPPQCRWERIVSIKKLEEKHHTIAVSVPEHHTFLTDFYEHNTFCMVMLALYYCCVLESSRILFIAPRMAQVEAFFDEFDKFLDKNPWLKEGMKRNSKRPHIKVFGNDTSIKGFTTGATSKGNGTGIRGQGAEILLLDEVAFINDDDFAAINPIINGDAYQAVPAITFAASTPGPATGEFYKWCEDTDSKFFQVRMAITENPDWTKEAIEEIRKGCTVREWESEYMVEFLSGGGTPFPRSLVELAQKDFNYAITQMPISKPMQMGIPPEKHVWRTMGVDWDKFNRDGSGPNIAVIETCDYDIKLSSGLEIPAGTIRVIYREHIKQSEYSLHNAVQRVIELNHDMNPDVIYVDAGLGELNIEELHLYGEKVPSSRLKQKVKRIQFSQVLDVEDPIGGTTKKQFKPFMVNLMSGMFEKNHLWFPHSDKHFFEQLTGYRIISETANNVTYSKENEHIIDAVGLALVALWKVYKNPFKRKPGMTGYMLPAPQVVSSKDMSNEEFKKLNKNQQTVLGVHRDNSDDKVIRHPIGQGDLSSGVADLGNQSRSSLMRDARSLMSRNLDRRLSSRTLRPPSSRSFSGRDRSRF